MAKMCHYQPPFLPRLYCFNRLHCLLSFRCYSITTCYSKTTPHSLPSAGSSSVFYNLPCQTPCLLHLTATILGRHLSSSTSTFPTTTSPSFSAAIFLLSPHLLSSSIFFYLVSSSSSFSCVSCWWALDVLVVLVYLSESVRVSP